MRLLKLAAVVLSAVGGLCQDNLGLANGYIDVATSNFNARVVRDAQVLASLTGSGSSFNFLPYDKISVRARHKQYHWGDLTIRYRQLGATSWTSADSAANRQPVEALAATGDVFASSDMARTLPSGTLSVIRDWLDVDGDLGLRFTIKNTGTISVEIGSLGFPAEFNSIFTNREPIDMQNLCSLSDPYIGLDAGQIRVTPVKGTGPAVVVTGLNGTTPLEAYRNLVEPSFSETYYGSQTFEGFYEWQVLSKAYAENEWKSQTPWNPATSRTLVAGESVQYGVRFSISNSGVRGLDQAVRNTGTPVAVGVPGYVVPRDLPATLLLQSDASVSSVAASPSGAFTISGGVNGRYTLTPSSTAWGRVRVTVEYDDGKTQTIHYYITKPTPNVLSDLGNFLTTSAWFNKSSDPFGRSPSPLTYDYEKRAILEQDSRVWVAGLSDEGGTGAYVAAVMKQAVQPVAAEVAKLDEFVNKVVWGKIQNTDHSVKKSIFFYEPSAVSYTYDTSQDWSSWTSWNRAAANATDRAYNYVHVAAAYWSMYRVARAYPSSVSQTWGWYLDHAQQTVIRMTGSGVGYNKVGLMGETVFGFILQDLQREGRTLQATALENAMRTRAQLWNSQEIPYGSEMAWDSTGQEGVYYWTRHFGFNESATKTINSVLGYTPNVPHWGWNGNSRRYWDFVYGGKLKRIERQIHHYGSGLNSQVLLGAYRDDPSDSYLLRVGYAGSTAPLSNINQDGFPSAAFHSWPDTLKWDGITGDYGGGFVGLALNSGTYVDDDEVLGLVAYGGVLSVSGSTATVQPRDPVRRRIFVGPLSLLVTIDAGAFTQFSYSTTGGSVSVTVAQQSGSPTASQVAIWTESTSGQTWKAAVTGSSAGRGGTLVPLPSSGSVAITLTRS